MHTVIRTCMLLIFGESIGLIKQVINYCKILVDSVIAHGSNGKKNVHVNDEIDGSQPFVCF